MNLIPVIAFFITNVFTAFTPPAEDGITINITNLRNDKGHVLVSLFKEGEGFPDKAEKAFRKEKAAISNKKAIIQFSSVPGGNYAVAILHDENDDAKMNKTWLGLPKEGYGFSNNVMGTLGPPVFSKARFTHTAGQSTTIEIKTKY
ncbi:MAG: DUF2141 domain-containing protein [Chitinophagales bacterium]|nr:DUF2141 domain-containing protein [Chitinophagales bacterium]